MSATNQDDERRMTEVVRLPAEVVNPWVIVPVACTAGTAHVQVMLALMPGAPRKASATVPLTLGDSW